MRVFPPWRFPPPLCGLLLPFLAACSIAPQAAVQDLAAIHDEKDWSPRSPARLVIAPGDYESGYRVVSHLRVGEPKPYEVADHRLLELAILDQLARTPPGQLDFSLEATGWLIIELLHDDHREARIKAAAVLSDFAAFWVDKGGVRLAPEPPAGDLAAAVQAYNAATDHPEAPDYAARVGAALQGIDEAALSDPLEAARLVVGMGRRLRAAPEPVTGGHALPRTGLRAVLLALQAGAGAADPEVAEACRSRHELIHQYASAD